MKDDTVEAIGRDMDQLRDRLLKIAQRSRQTGTPGPVSPRATLQPKARASMKPEAAKKATTPKRPIPPQLKQFAFKKGQARGR